jgi:hypothetical protein
MIKMKEMAEKNMIHTKEAILGADSQLTSTEVLLI